MLILLRAIMFLMPVWFGVFFLAPLTVEILELFTTTPATVALPLVGQAPLLLVLMVSGGLWGGLSMWRKRWI